MREEAGQDVLLSEPPFFGCSNTSNRDFCLQQPLELVNLPLQGGFAVSDAAVVLCQFVLLMMAVPKMLKEEFLGQGEQQSPLNLLNNMNFLY